ncbi:MAG TPA: 1-acyl-sn-glycerol-3-phosphate acyltransferase, partial [Planctomycetota bacterium]|nr:1-acyl-sn-glycerol-3-phosphate acyltransferase [Planctomycetota bacterium]
MKRALVLLVRLATRLFYRQERLGRAVPADGPALLVANHPNGLLDPALVLSVTERDVLFLGKEPLFRMPVVGWLVRRLGVVPVHRAQDGADTAQNAAAFAAVHVALEHGGVVALFPEGRAHDEPSLQRLKT